MVANVQAIMAKGSKALKECCAILNIPTRQFRKNVFRNQLDLSNLTPDKKARVESLIPDVMEVRQIEGIILKKYARLVNRHAGAIWARSKFKNPSLSREDFYQEAHIALLDALYSYEDENTKFITYAWWCIKNRLNSVLNHNNHLKFSIKAIKLLNKFELTKALFNCHVTQDQVIEQMNLSDKEKIILNNALVTVINSSVFEKPGESYDYTDIRKGIDKEENNATFEVRDALAKADLSDLERKIVEAFKVPYYGWQEDIASNNINPRTGIRYSRAAIAVMLEAALKKIKKVYHKV